jgi:uncharacterized protein DUF2442
MTQSEFPYEFADVVYVEPRGGHRLFLRFLNGNEGEYDFSELIAEGGPMVQPLRDEPYFARVLIDDGILAWPNGFDLDSIALHDRMKSAARMERSAIRGRLLHPLNRCSRIALRSIRATPRSGYTSLPRLLEIAQVRRWLIFLRRHQ